MVGFFQLLRYRVHNPRRMSLDRVITTAALTTLLLMLVPSHVHAQKPIAGLITDLFDRSTINAPSSATGLTDPTSGTLHRWRKPQTHDARSEPRNCLTGGDVPNPIFVRRVHVQRERQRRSHADQHQLWSAVC